MASLGHIFFGYEGVNSSAKSSRPNHILLTTVPWYQKYSQCQNLQNSTLCSSIVATYAYSFTISIAGSLGCMATLNVMPFTQFDVITRADLTKKIYMTVSSVTTMLSQLP